MIPALLASGIMLYEIIQMFVAFIAVFLAVKWNKPEFLPGLSFLLLYTIFSLIDVFFFTIVEGSFLDIAQFGFILCSIICFIIGMHPTLSPKLISDTRQRSTGIKASKSESVLSIIKKI